MAARTCEDGYAAADEFTNASYSRRNRASWPRLPKSSVRSNGLVHRCISSMIISGSSSYCSRAVPMRATGAAIPARRQASATRGNTSSTISIGGLIRRGNSWIAALPNRVASSSLAGMKTSERLTARAIHALARQWDDLTRQIDDDNAYDKARPAIRLMVEMRGSIACGDSAPRSRGSF